MMRTSQHIAGPVSRSEKHLNKEELQAILEQVADKRDRKAFSMLFHYFAPRLKAFALAKPFASDRNQFADELIQEVMIKVWDKADTYDARYANVSTWIFSIARNTRIDMIRRYNRRDFPLDSEEIFDFTDDSVPDLFQQAQQKNYERDIKQYFSQLSAEQSQVLAKVYMEGKSHTEVALELDLPLGTVKSRVRLALAKLKAMVVH